MTPSRRQGAQIPGVVRGAPTQKYLTKVATPHHFSWCVLPWIGRSPSCILSVLYPYPVRQHFVISAAGLLIVVGVVRDTFTIIETELKVHGYDESIIKG